MIANSERDARKLAKDVDPHTTDFDRYNSGILIGSCTKMNIKELSQETIAAIAFCCSSQQQQVLRVAVVTKRAFLPKLGYNGLIVKAGETVIAIDPGISDKFVRVENFLSVFANNQYHSLLKGQICHVVMEGGEDQTQFWSGFHLVQKPTETVYFKISEIKRKVLLYPNHEETFVVLDYSRPTTPYTPIVPCFPEKEDVVQVLGEEEEWFGQVTSVSERDKTVQVQPLMVNGRWPGRNLYLRERRQHMSSETVHWNSILQVANGRWHSGTCWEWRSPLCNCD